MKKFPWGYLIIGLCGTTVLYVIAQMIRSPWV